MITLQRTPENEIAAKELCYERLEDAGYGVGKNTMAVTSDSLYDFTHAWGRPIQDKDLEDLPHGVWHNVQRTKGEPRGTLVIIDFGEFRVANFC